jgi:outer membrane cobalamin receptor
MQIFQDDCRFRLTDHSEFGRKYVPRYGVIITPYTATAIKMNYGKHYNAPTPNDLFGPMKTGAGAWVLREISICALRGQTYGCRN